jgi:hypothetical protein
MKILKTTTYNSLIETISELEEDITRLVSEKNILAIDVSILDPQLNHAKKQNEIFINNFAVKRCVIGKKGSGKTTFIKENIIRQIRNYFLIESNNEYSSVLSSKKLDLSETNDTVDFILEKIKENESKLIVLEEIFMSDSDRIKIYTELIMNGYQFVIVASSIKFLKKWIDSIDCVYKLGEMIEEDFEAKLGHKLIITN